MYWVQYHSIKIHRFITTGSANYGQCSKAYHKIHYGTISDEALPIGTVKTTSSHIPALVQFLRSYVTQMCSSEVRLCYGSVSLYLCRTVILPSSNVEVQRCAQVSMPWVYISSLSTEQVHLSAFFQSAAEQRNYFQ